MGDRWGARRGRVTPILAGLFAAALLGLAETVPADDTEHMQVVVLYSDSAAVRGSLDFDAEFRRVVAATMGDRVEIDHDFLDLIRNESPEYVDAVLSFLHSKYADRPPELLVPVGLDALQMVLAHRDRLFPAARVLFCHVDRHELDSLTLPDDVAGVVSDWNYSGLVGLAARLQPQLKRVVLILGSSPLERSIERWIRPELHVTSGRVGFEIWSDRSMPEIERGIANLNSEAAVVFVMMYRDADGERYRPREALSRVISRSKVPVYFPFSSGVGLGVVGDGSFDIQEMGRVTAEAAHRLLAGENPSAVGRRVLPPAPGRFDARELARFRIPISRLPPGSRVEFESSSLWRDYRWQIVAVLAILVAQTAMIAGYFIHRRLQRVAAATRREGEVRASAVLDALHERVAVLDRQGVITSANRAWNAFARSHGRSDLGEGSSFTDACRQVADFGNRDASRTLDGIECVLEGHLARFEIEYVARPDDEGIWSALTAVPLAHPDGGAVVSIADVTEHRRLEAEALQRRSELEHFGRVATLGELSAAIAHELNQPLTGIVANAQASQRFLERGAAEQPEVADGLADIVSDARRAGEVIRRLRELLRKGSVEVAPLDLNGVVEEVVNLTASDVQLRGAILEVELGDGLPRVAADRVHLQQVLINLILNGLDAMVETPADRRRLRVRTGALDDRRLWLAVEDSGCGIPEEVLDRLFEPFLTTKPEGMGMGLSIVRSVVERHGGEVTGANNPGGGATFRVSLPAALTF
jgi:signal transduction histidine kinase